MMVEMASLMGMDIMVVAPTTLLSNSRVELSGVVFS